MWTWLSPANHPRFRRSTTRSNVNVRLLVSPATKLTSWWMALVSNPRVIRIRVGPAGKRLVNSPEDRKPPLKEALSITTFPLASVIATEHGVWRPVRASFTFPCRTASAPTASPIQTKAKAAASHKPCPSFITCCRSAPASRSRASGPQTFSPLGLNSHFSAAFKICFQVTSCPGW